MAPSSLFLKAAALAVVGLGSGVSALFPYQIDDVYQGSPDGTGFFDMFNFFTDPDPNGGYVDYLDSTDAFGPYALTSINQYGQAYMGVDHKTYYNGTNAVGRPSVRIQSKKLYNGGLFIADIVHMPGSICGVWPAFWTVGLPPNYPADGEIDIIENISERTQNLETLHTNAGCNITKSAQKGTAQGDGVCDNGYQNPPDQYLNQGCSVNDDKSANQPSYGTPFNTALGGVYAMEWTATTIKIWNFPRGQIPSDLTSGAPNPSGWGAPTLTAGGDGLCDVTKHFKNHNMIFDTTFCGGFVDAFWTDTSCYSAGWSTCESYVAANPDAFEQAFWLVNSVKVYQRKAPTTTSTTTTHSSTSTSHSPTSTSHSSTTTSHSSTSSTSTSHSSTTTSHSSTSSTSTSHSTTSSTSTSTSHSSTSSSHSSTASTSTSTSHSTSPTSTSTSHSSTSSSHSSTSPTSTSTSSTSTSHSPTSTTSTSTSTSSSSTATSTTSSSSSASTTSSSTTSTSTSTSSSATTSTSPAGTSTTSTSALSKSSTNSPTTSTSSILTSSLLPLLSMKTSSSPTGYTSPLISGMPTSPVGSSGPYGNSSTTAVQMTTSTVYTTATYTITKCPATITNCPARSTTVVTSTIALYTTVCPVSGIKAHSSIIAHDSTTSTVFTTEYITVTHCPPTVTNCPAHSTKVYTSTYALYTTVCPVVNGASLQATVTPPVAIPAIPSAAITGAASASSPVVEVVTIPVIPVSSVYYAAGNNSSPASLSGSAAAPSNPTANPSTFTTSGARTDNAGGAMAALLMVAIAGMFIL